jgi:hydroxypyruvate isomerase
MKRRAFLKSASVFTAALPTAQPPLPPRAKVTSSVMLWTLKGTLEEKLEMATKAGLQSVELVSEYASWSDDDIARVKKICRSFDLGMDTIIATPDWGKRPVSMVDPAHREGFLADVRQAIVFAHKLGVPHIILMSGNEIPARSRAEQYASMLEGAKRAADLAASAGLTLIVEPLNSLVNHKDYYLNTCTEGLKLVREVGNPHLKLLFDIYHEQVQAGNVIQTLTECAPHVAVYHVADSPGRHDPGTGELNWPNIYKAIQKTGFAGYITMEYLPLGDPVASLKKAVTDFRAAITG